MRGQKGGRTGGARGVVKPPPGGRGAVHQAVPEGGEEALVNIQDAIREYLAARDDLIEDSDIREVEVAV